MGRVLLTENAPLHLECGRRRTLTRPSPASARGRISLGLKRARVRIYSLIEKFPRPFRWERVRVRAISLSVGERDLMNHFVSNSCQIARLSIVTRSAGMKRNVRLPLPCDWLRQCLRIRQKTYGQWLVVGI